MTAQKALITGITGQDGSYVAEVLLETQRALARHGPGAGNGGPCTGGDDQDLIDVSRVVLDSAHARAKRGGGSQVRAPWTGASRF